MFSKMIPTFIHCFLFSNFLFTFDIFSSHQLYNYILYFSRTFTKTNFPTQEVTGVHQDNTIIGLDYIDINSDCLAGK